MLNPQQLAAVEYCDGPLLVLAGAGSGKTSVITQKIAHLIAAPASWRRRRSPRSPSPTRPRARCASAWASWSAARTPPALTVCTFHALGLKFLQIEHARAGLRRGFSVLDADDSDGIVKELAPQGREARRAVRASATCSAAPRTAACRRKRRWPPARSPRELEAATIYDLYQQRLAAFNAVDFDDLIRLPLRILEADADCRAGWRERIRYLLVDEYQDTNDAQYRLLKALAGERGDITCVGDDDQ